MDFILFQKDAIFKLGKQTLKNGESSVALLAPFDKATGKSVWTVTATKLDDLIFDTRTQASGEPAYEVVELGVPKAKGSTLVAGPIEIEDTTTGEVFTGTIGDADKFLERPQTANAQKIEFRYVRTAPVPEAIVNYDGPVFAYVMGTDLTDFILKVTVGTTISCSTDYQAAGKNIRVLPIATKGATIAPNPVQLSGGRKKVTLSVQANNTVGEIDVRAADPDLLRALLSRHPDTALQRLVDRLFPANP